MKQASNHPLKETVKNRGRRVAGPDSQYDPDAYKVLITLKSMEYENQLCCTR